jgi:peptidoglycan hydrolase-like protein with peptidoglycan-binding domain
MPVNPTIRSLAQDGRFSQADAQTLRQAVQSGQVSQTEARDAAHRYAEAMEPEAARTLQDSFQASPRTRLTSLPESMLGQTLQRGMRSDAVQTLQRGLMAVGLSSQNPGMALGSGADGIFGRETETSVKAFQKANGLPETGRADPATLKALQQALTGAPSTPTSTTTPPTPSTTPTTPAQAVRPATGLRRPEATTTPETTPTPAPTTPASTPAPTTPASTPAPRAAPTIGVTLPEGVKPGTTEALIAASRDLATGDRAKHYGTVNPWRNIDPNHAAPVDVRMGGLTNRWKCNLFGGNAMAAAGFEPPYYGNRSKGGEYPVAEQWHRWSTPSAEFRERARAAGEVVTDHAKQAKNPSRFELADEVRPTAIPDEAARRARVEALLARVQPGDVVTVDHPGASGSDGGHVRVCVGRDENGKPLFAQARQDSAVIEAEGVDDDNWLTRDAIYILRPTTPRATDAR